jgi:hypothetical protein
VTGCQMRGVRWVGDDSYFVSPETAGWKRKCETEHCHGEATRSVLSQVRGDVFARFHAVDAKRRSRTRTSQFGLLGPVLRATTTSVEMAAPVRNILETASWGELYFYLYFNFIVRIVGNTYIHATCGRALISSILQQAVRIIATLLYYCV